MPEPIVLLAQDGVSTRCVHHALTVEFGDVPVVFEREIGRWNLLKRRARRLGVVTAVGQALFAAAVVPALRRSGRERIAQIRRDAGLDDSPIRGRVLRVGSVNSEETRALLRSMAPSVVVVNGTRVIEPATLDAVDAVFINTHAGITPAYRGVHGGYWALSDRRPDRVGSTVHLVDAGIDTGAVIEQATFDVTPKDSFATYPYLHIAAAIPLLLRAVRAALNGGVASHAPDASSGSVLRSHPTLWGYAARRIRQGVR